MTRDQLRRCSELLSQLEKLEKDLTLISRNRVLLPDQCRIVIDYPNKYGVMMGSKFCPAVISAMVEEVIQNVKGELTSMGVAP